MSYARFGWDDSDVYVYLDCGGYLTCCGCSLSADSSFPAFYSTADMLAHLRQHRMLGHVVPQDALDQLRADRAENDVWIAKRTSEANA